MHISEYYRLDPQEMDFHFRGLSKPMVQPPLTFRIASSSSSSSPSFYSVDDHKTFPVCDLSLPSFSLLSFPKVDDYHLFLDLQAQVSKKLDVEEIMKYEPVICHCPEFWAI
ncbi:hypothetical protein HMI54_005198 [Coelomomyces lativittatus]|nr:hypothetical protein HMI54_005198 [Coelomomyces lativittatus]